MRDRTHQGFIQIDVPAEWQQHRHQRRWTRVLKKNFVEQTLLYLDYAFSQELYNSGRGRRGGNFEVRRLLGLAELHYTTTLGRL